MCQSPPQKGHLSHSPPPVASCRTNVVKSKKWQYDPARLKTVDRAHLPAADPWVSGRRSRAPSRQRQRIRPVRRLCRRPRPGFHPGCSTSLCRGHVVTGSCRAPACPSPAHHRLCSLRPASSCHLALNALHRIQAMCGRFRFHLVGGFHVSSLAAAILGRIRSTFIRYSVACRPRISPVRRQLYFRHRNRYRRHRCRRPRCYRRPS